MVLRCQGLEQELTLRVHVPNNLVLGIWVIVIIVQVWGKCIIIRYLDPLGYCIPRDISQGWLQRTETGGRRRMRLQRH